MRSNAGFTLIEVLIALAILSIALTAVIKATSQNIKDNAYIQNKTIATWVASQVMNESRVGVIKVPTAPDKLEEETEMLGRTWKWQASLNPTPNQHIKEVQVKVFDSNEHLFTTLESYIYIQQVQS